MRSDGCSVLFVLLTTLWTSAVPGTETGGHQGEVDQGIEFNVESVRQQLITDIDYVVSCRQVPGLAVAVVHDGRPLLVRGFGSARLRQENSDEVDQPVPVPVTENTKFAIASLSKAFTATLIGILLKEQETKYPLRWDTRVADVMGSDFRFVDDMRTRQTTIRDLLAHRTGLPSYKMALMVGLEPAHSRQDYCLRMRHMEFAETGPTSFRNQFIYNNVMYLVAGCVAERLGGGQPLERLMSDRLFRPLGMNDSHFISELKNGVENDTRLATMYYWNATSGRLQKLNYRILRTVLPLDAAGGVITTAADMTRWLEFHLNTGRDSAGNQLLPVSYWLQIHSPQMALEQPLLPVVKPWFPASDTHSAYGFGWRLGLYRGRTKSEHAGRLAAFDSQLTIIHAERLAVFTANNGPLYTGRYIHLALHFLIIDSIIASTNRTLREDAPWLNQSTACTYPQPWLSHVPPPLPALIPPQSTLPPVIVPERPADGWLVEAHWVYVGRYGHLLLGNFTVSFQHMEDTPDGGALLFQVGSIGRGRLAYADGLTWLMQFDDLAYFSRFGSHREVPLPVVFHDREPPTAGAHSGRFQAVVVIPFEPLAPPVFRRGLHWDPATDKHRSATISWQQQTIRVVLLQLNVVALAMTIAY